MNDQKKSLLISFSGGLTSAFMTHLLLEDKSFCSQYCEVFCIFANTGQEHPKTLDFVERCSQEFGLNVIWVEASVNPEKNKGTLYNVVNHNSASRDGEPFEDVIKKYGLPNVSYPHCTRELKMAPIHAYMKANCKTIYDTAIGIRFDEFDRVAKDFKKRRIIYPLINRGVKLRDVLSFWEKQPFTLGVKNYQGNCVWCFKKSFSKHAKLIAENPEAYDFPAKMERLYSDAGAGGTREIFRKRRTTADLIMGVETNADFMKESIGGGCSETCELFGGDL